MSWGACLFLFRVESWDCFVITEIYLHCHMQQRKRVQGWQLSAGILICFFCYVFMSCCTCILCYVLQIKYWQVLKFIVCPCRNHQETLVTLTTISWWNLSTCQNQTNNYFNQWTRQTSMDFLTPILSTFSILHDMIIYARPNYAQL